MLTCANCSRPIQEGQAITIPGKGKTTTSLCVDCASALENAFDEETEDPNLLGAFLLALGAALISAIIWFGFVVVTEYQLGIVAVAVGWIVAQAAMLGAGRKRGFSVQLISVMATGLAVLLSEYLIDRHFLVQYLTSEGYTDIPLLLPLDVTMEMIVEIIKSDPTTLLFWGIAIFEAFAIPKKRQLKKR
jgi:hypothetical protein